MGHQLARANPRLARHQAYIDATYRIHAQVEGAIRTGKDYGIGKFPSSSMA